MLILCIKWHQRYTQFHFKNLKYRKQHREINTPWASVCVCDNPRFNFWNSCSTFNEFSMIRSALFRDITWRRVVISHRHFGTNYLSHVQGSRNPSRRTSSPSKMVHSCQQKSIGLKFSKSQTGSDLRYSCHHNSSRFTFPIFAHSCRFSVLHSLQTITPRIY